MEEIKNKLQAGSPAGAVNDALQQVYEFIVSSPTPESCHEIKILFDGLRSPFSVVSHGSSSLLLTLMTEGHLHPTNTRKNILSSVLVSPVIHISSIVRLISGILPLESPFDFGAHPFLSLLRSSPSSWTQIEVEIRKNPLFYENLLFCLFVTPVNQYSHIVFLRSHLKTLLLEDTEKVFAPLRQNILKWLQYHVEDSHFENVRLALSFLKIDFPNANSFRLSLALISLKFSMDLRPILESINNLDDICLILLSELVRESSTPECIAIMETCSPFLLSKPLFFSSVASASLLASLIPMASSSSYLSQLTSQLLSSYHEHHLSFEFDEKNHFLWDCNVMKAHSFLVLLQKIHNNQWDWLSNSNNKFNDPTILTILLFSNNTSEDVNSRVLKLLSACAIKDSRVIHSTLLLISHKVSQNFTRLSPSFLLSLLQALPTFAVDKNYIRFIFSVIESSTSSKPSLIPLKLRLLSDLWHVEKRTYPLLQKALESLDLTSSSSSSSSSLALQITVASIVRSICKTSQCGALAPDLLPLLSKLLNAPLNKYSFVPQSLSLDSIYLMVQSSVIDIKTTLEMVLPLWKPPPFRPLITHKLMKLFELAPSFLPHSTEAFCYQNVKFLWSLESEEFFKDIVIDVLSHYPLRFHALSVLPTTFFQKFKISTKNTEKRNGGGEEKDDDDDDAEDESVPPELWMSLLSDFESYSPLILSLLKEELVSFPRSVFALGDKEEPTTYFYLPETSILKALVVSFVSKYPRMGLFILSSLTSRLPPLDWSFLEHLYDDEKTRLYKFQILVQQSGFSRSAARLLLSLSLKSYLPVLSYLNSEVLLSHKDLEDFLVSEVLTSQNEDEKELQVEQILKAYKKVDEAFKDKLQIVLFKIIVMVPVDVLKTTLSKAVDEIPINLLESTMALQSFSTFEAFKRSLVLRCILGEKSETPLMGMNECIEAVRKKSPEYISFLLDSINWLIKRTRSRSTCIKSHRNWLLELMGQIRGVLRRNSEGEDNEDDKIHLHLLTKVFSLSLFLFSEADKYFVNFQEVENSSEQLGFSFMLLMTKTPETPLSQLGLQFAEWLIQLRTLNKNSLLCISKISSCVSAFKYSSSFSESWTKLIS